MKRKLSPLYYLIPALYAGLIILFVFLQFNRERFFNTEFHGIRISGERTSILKGKKRIKSLKISLYGVDFFFSNKNKLQIITKNSARELSVKEFSMGENSLKIMFENNGEIAFSLENSKTSQDGKNQLVINQRNLAPKGDSDFRIIIPFSLSTKNYQATENVPLLSYTWENEKVAILLPAGSYFMPEGHQMIWHIGGNNPDNGIRVVRIKGKTIPFFLWYSRMMPKETEADLGREVERYLEKAYMGWRGDRFIESSGRWKMPDGSVRFDERIIASAVAETLTQIISPGKSPSGKNISTIPLFLEALRKELRTHKRGKLPFLTSPYFGGLKRFLKNVQTEDADRLKKIIVAIRKGDESIFLEENLVTLILDRGPFSLIEELTKFADSLKDSGTLKVEVMLLKYYADLINYTGYRKTYNERINSIIVNKIIPNLIPIGGNLFLGEIESKEILIDSRISLYAGCLLHNLSDSRYRKIVDKSISNEELKEIGRKMVVSVIKLADHYGYFPESVRVKDYFRSSPKISESAGKDLIKRIAPEEIYPMLVSIVKNRRKNYYPKETPLYLYTEPGEWIWSSVDITNLDFNKNNYNFSLEYPVRESYFILIQGIPPVKEIYLHGIKWKPDPQYFRYRDGWFYEKDSRSLFMKITQRESTEKLKISF